MSRSSWSKCYFTGVIFLVFLTGCVPYSKLQYVSDFDELNEPVINPAKSKTLSPFDEINVVVLSTDDQTANLLNYTNTGRAGSVQGYVVDELGDIHFPFVGNIHVEGLTLEEAKAKITSSISSIIKDPEVIVQFVNNRITVLGEVSNQGSFPINKEFLTIYETIAMGGGMTQFADRQKVILVRKENNQLVHYKLDLSNSKITSSPLYYIFPNDIIIVEPLKKKAFASQGSPLVSFLGLATSVLAVIAMVIRINN